jgi:hypothetical protein
MSELVLASCDPRDREVGLKELFARNGKPSFASVFDKLYRPRADHGLRSWFGIDGERIVMHISVTPMRFVSGDRVVKGGVLGDLMVDDQHRDFWGPVRMLRQLITDLKRTGQADFLITTTTADAEPIFKASGFKPHGLLRRFVLPVNLPYLGFFKLKSRGRLRANRPRVLPRCDYSALPTSSGGVEAFRPEPAASFYDTHIPRLAFADGTWLTVPGSNGQGAGYALVSRSAQLPGDLSLADAFWSDRSVSLGQVMHAAAGWARKQHFRKLRVTTLKESRAARQLTQAGFVPRQILSYLLVNQLTAVELPPVDHWFLTSFALSSW